MNFTCFHSCRKTEIVFLISYRDSILHIMHFENIKAKASFTSLVWEILKYFISTKIFSHKFNLLFKKDSIIWYFCK